MLMTNQGDVMEKILRSRYGHEKEYFVKVDHKVTDEFLKKMGEGVPILDTVTKPCKVWKEDDFSFHIILTQGLNRQIRRMCSNLGYKVVKLKRIRIMNIELNDLPAGATRKIEGSEYEKLMNLINKK